jgi:CheY-like chemotaxis protein
MTSGEPRLLFVSPDERAHASVRGIFEQSGWRVLEETTGRAALERLKADPSAVVLVSGGLSDCSWNDFLAEVRLASGGYPVILCSPLADEALWSEALASGAWDVLSEPFDPDEVRRVAGHAWDSTWGTTASGAALQADVPAPPLPQSLEKILDQPLRAYLETSALGGFLAGFANGVLFHVSDGLASQLARPVSSLRGRHIRELLTDADWNRLREKIDAGRGATHRFGMNFLDRDLVPCAFDCRLESTDDGFVLVCEAVEGRGARSLHDLVNLNNELIVRLREVQRDGRARHERGNRTLNETLDALVKACDQLQRIREMFPQCVVCGRVSTDSGSLGALIAFLAEDDLLIKEGLCPDCRERDASGQEG